MADTNTLTTSTGKVWKAVACHGCGGRGVVSVYSAYDFKGPGECRVCNGGGRLWESPAGKVALYPGGPFRG